MKNEPIPAWQQEYMNELGREQHVLWRGEQWGVTTTMDLGLGVVVLRQNDENGDDAVALTIEQLPGIIAALQGVLASRPATLPDLYKRMFPAAGPKM